VLTNEHAAAVSTDPAPSIQFDPIAEGEADTARGEALSASAPPGALPASAPTEAISASGDRGRRRRLAWIALVVLFGCFEIDQLRALFGYSRLATDEDQTLLWFAGRELLNEIGGRPPRRLAIGTRPLRWASFDVWMWLRSFCWRRATRYSSSSLARASCSLEPLTCNTFRTTTSRLRSDCRRMPRLRGAGGGWRHRRDHCGRGCDPSPRSAPRQAQRGTRGNSISVIETLERRAPQAPRRARPQARAASRISAVAWHREATTLSRGTPRPPSIRSRFREHRSGAKGDRLLTRPKTTSGSGNRRRVAARFPRPCEHRSSASASTAASQSTGSPSSLVGLAAVSRCRGRARGSAAAAVSPRICVAAGGSGASTGLPSGRQQAR